MSDWFQTVATSGLIAAFSAAVVTMVWDYRRMRRSELLDAYSQWIEAINLAVTRGLIYFDAIKAFAPLQAHQFQQAETVKRSIAAGNSGRQAELEALGDRMVRDMHPVMDANAQAIVAEHQLSVAHNRVNLVERTFRFRKTVRELSILAYRDLPKNATPATLVGLAEVFQSRVEALTQTRVPDLIKQVIEEHWLRGLCSEDADPG